MGGIKVIIFDDHDMIRDSITMLFNESSDFELLASYGDCMNVIEHIQQLKPDVVIMDIDMPGLSGIEGVRMIRKNFPSVQVLMQTVFDDEEKIFAAIAAGAGGYILKGIDSSKILEAVSEVYHGGAPMTPSIARKVLSHLKDLTPQKEDYNLSAREKEVLGLLVNGLSYKMIAAQMNITYDTVRAHMKKVYEKLHVSSMTEAVAKAIHKKLFGMSL
ncbi:MAG: response regulator transcription factor [Bacteroidetes bacterium]|jgi:DNA-binding NarL/FixJ family response regulator|nr:response regulator transcription factor [Bacteroidota bacterium]